MTSRSSMALRVGVLCAGATLALALVMVGCTSRSTVAADAVETVVSTFDVDGMTCGGCEAGVKVKVGKLDGVRAVAASHEEGKAEITYDPNQVTARQIVAAIAELGYEATLVETSDPST